MQRKKLIEARLRDLVLTIAATSEGIADNGPDAATLIGAKEALEWALGQEDEPAPPAWLGCEKIQCLGRAPDDRDAPRRVVLGTYPMFPDNPEEILLCESQTRNDERALITSDYLWVGGTRLTRGQVVATMQVLLHWLEEGRLPRIDPKKTITPPQQPELKQ